VLRVALERLGAGERVVVATVLRRRGSAPSTPGQKLVLHASGAAGTVGGGAIELRVLEAMTALLAGAETRPETVSFELGARLGMCCGGAVEILLEPMDPAVTALVVGAGHVGGALAPLLAELGFRVVVCDARDGALEARALGAARGGGAGPGARWHALALEHDDPEVLSAVGAGRARAAAVVMTHDHKQDQAVIEWALAQGFGLVGGVGSRAKAARTRSRLEAKGIAPADVARVRMPLGVDIGARSPMEIAVAVAGELVAWRSRLCGTARHGCVARADGQPDDGETVAAGDARDDAVAPG
jgi:xanthine dehydrogenase accessory factor